MDREVGTWKRAKDAVFRPRGWAQNKGEAVTQEFFLPNDSSMGVFPSNPHGSISTGVMVFLAQEIRCNKQLP